ncbi:hypothetical protein V8F20_010307 [Naviculisporaceae sp. PSN 640]
MADGRGDRVVAGNALKWLVAAQRPVTVFELHGVIQIARSENDSFIAAGEFITSASLQLVEIEEAKAVSVIDELLGKKALEYTREPALENTLCVRLALSSRKRRIGDKDFSELVQKIDFTKSKAHQYALSICLGICRVATLTFGSFRIQQPHLLGVVTYAWTYWSVHHFLAFKYSPPNQKVVLNTTMMGQLERTTRNVLAASVSLLAMLNNWLIPLATPSTPDVIDERVLLSKDALDFLDVPLTLLSEAILPIPHHSITQLLENPRHLYQSAMSPQPADRLAGREPLSPALLSGIHFNMIPGIGPLFNFIARISRAGLPIKHIGVWPHPVGLDTECFLDVVKRQTSLGSFREPSVVLAGIALRIRLLSTVLAQEALAKDLMKDPVFNEASPLDALMNVANFLEGLACYPFWNYMPKPYSEQYLEIEDTKPGSSVRLARYQEWARNDKPFIEIRSDPHDELRFHRLTVFGWTLGFSRHLSGFQDLALSLKRDSFPIPELGPRTTRASCYQGACPGNAVLTYLHGPSTFNGVSGVQVEGLYLKLKSALLSDGYLAALVTITGAIVANHVRSIFAPWLGIGIWKNPLEQLRLSHSNPEVFLNEFHAQSWTFILFSLAQIKLLRYPVAVCVGQLVQGAAHETRLMVPLYGQGSGMGFVFYIAWIFTTVEYLFSASVVLFAVAMAVWNLASSDLEAANLALWMVIGKHWSKTIFMAGHMLYFLLSNALPILSLAFQLAANGHIGLPVFIGGLVALVRAIILYRSFFFIALEVSGMFVAGGWFLLGCWILLAWFWDDPVGVKSTVAQAKHSGSVASIRLVTVAAHREENPDNY